MALSLPRDRRSQPRESAFLLPFFHTSDTSTSSQRFPSLDGTRKASLPNVHPLPLVRA